MAQRYTTPDEGTIDWHVPLNENFDLLDLHVEVRDTETNLQNYAPDAGAKFYATDTGRRYIGDGSQWQDASLALPATSAAPSDPATGQIWYDTNDVTLKLETTDGTVDIV